MITVHHLENSRSQRILWLLEELGAEYEVKRYERNKKTMLAPESLKQVHPLGKSPVITDGDLTIAESGTITEYLIHKYGNIDMHFQPGTKQWLDCSYWMHYAEGSLMPMMVMKLIFSQVKRAPMPFFARPIAKSITGKVMGSFIQPNINNHLAFVNAHLKGKTWFVDEKLTGADFQMIFPLEAAAARDKLPERYPEIQRYLEHVHNRPAYQKALTVGGPYKLMS